MDTKRLEMFIKIVEAGGISRAAKLLGVAQPVISSQLSILEAHFRTRLVARTSSGVTPTAAGQALYRHAKLLLKQLEQAHAEVGHASVAISGTVTLAMSMAAAEILTVPLLRIARERLPRVKIDVSQGLNAAMLDEFTASGRVDIGLLPGPVTAKVRSVPLFAERLVLVVARESALGATFDPIDMVDLRKVPMILPGRINHLRRVIDGAFLSRGLEPLVIAEMNSIYNLGKAAAQNLGATIMPVAAANMLAEQVVIRELLNPTPERTTWLAVTDAGPTSDAVAAVFDLVKEVCFGLIETGAWTGARVIEDNSSFPVADAVL